MTLNFFISCVPFKASHHHKKIIRIPKKGRSGEFWTRLGDKPELVQARNTYEAMLQAYRPEQPLEGPVALSLGFHFPFLKSASKKSRVNGAPKTTKPDCSNLAKTFEDCLVRMGFLQDDAQVCKLVVNKVFSEQTGISVSIATLDNRTLNNANNSTANNDVSANRKDQHLESEHRQLQLGHNPNA